MSREVEQLTRRAKQNGRAVRGPWEVTVDSSGRSALYHYGHKVAESEPGNVFPRIMPRPGYALSHSDREGVLSWGESLDLPSEKVREAISAQPFNRQAYGITYEETHQFPNRREMETISQIPVRASRRARAHLRRIR
jgi:hypothetical protein